MTNELDMQRAERLKGPSIMATEAILLIFDGRSPPYIGTIEEFLQ